MVPDLVNQPGYVAICLLSFSDPYFWLTFGAQRVDLENY